MIYHLTHIPAYTYTPLPIYPLTRFEHRRRREKQTFERTVRCGVSRTTGRNGFETLLGADNLDFELWEFYGYERGTRVSPSTNFGLAVVNTKRF